MVRWFTQSPGLCVLYNEQELTLSEARRGLTPSTEGAAPTLSEALLVCVRVDTCEIDHAIAARKQERGSRVRLSCPPLLSSVCVCVRVSSENTSAIVVSFGRKQKSLLLTSPPSFSAASMNHCAIPPTGDDTIYGGSGPDLIIGGKNKVGCKSAEALGR